MHTYVQAEAVAERLETKLPGYEQGVVVSFNAAKGWGFIKRPDKTMLFVHFRDIVEYEGMFRRLHDGQEVRYRVGKRPQGFFAYNVCPTRQWFVYEPEKHIKPICPPRTKRQCASVK